MPKKQLSAFPEFLTDCYLALLFSVFILYTGANGYSSLQQAKYDLFRLLSSGYLLLLIVFWLERRIIGTAKPLRPSSLRMNIQPIHGLLLFYWLLTTLSTLFSPYREQAFVGMTRNEGFLTISLYCATFFCISRFAKPKPWLKWLLGATMTVFGVICIIQLMGKNPFHLYPDSLNYYDANLEYAGIYLGTVGNAGLVAALQVLTIPIFLTIAIRGHDRLRWLFLLPALLNLAVLVKVQIQAGILAIGLGFLLGLPAVLPFSKKHRCKAYALAGCLLAAGLAFVLLSHSTTGTIYEFREVLHGNFDSRFGNGRLHIWKNVLARIPEHPWLGTGPDTMAAAGIKGFFWTPVESADPIQLYIDTAHNDYLNILFHQGLPALATYLAALLLTAIRWLKRSAASPPVAALGLGLLCYGIQAFFSFSMCHVAALFWTAWALLDNAIEHMEVQS